MKIKIISLCIFLISFQTIISEENFFDNFDYYRAYANYNGTAYNGSSIIVYGDAGVITLSIDGGKNWMRVSLTDSFNIMGITNIGEDYFGVLSKKYIIKSIDNGLNWQLFDFGEIDFYKIIPHNNNLYCISTNKIIVYNQNIEKIKEFNISVDSAYYDFTISGDNLIYSSENEKLTEINLLDDNVKEIKISDFGICTDCPVPTNLFSGNDKVYFNLGYNLYSYNGINCELVFDTGRKCTFTSNNSNLYAVYSIIYTPNIIDSLFFVKINEENNNSERINKAETDRYITFLSFNRIEFISQDTIIAIGKEMLIYMSYDCGLSWQLKSHYNPNLDFGDKFLFDREHAIFVGAYAKFVKTTDGGVTWLPQTNYDSRFIDSRFKDISNFSKSFFINKEYGFAYYYTDIQNEINFAYTNDGGETVSLKNSNEMIGYPSPRPFKVCLNNKQTLFAHPGSYKANRFTLIYRLNDELDVTNRTLLDSNQVIFMDTFEKEELFAIVINYKSYKKIDNYSFYDSVYISLLSSNDTAVTWQNIMDLDILDTNSTITNVSRVGNNIFISRYGKKDDSTLVYKLNTQTKQIEKIFSRKNWQSNIYGLVGVGSKTYISAVNFTNDGLVYELLQNDNLENQPTVWKNVMPKERYSYISVVSKYDSLVFISSSYDSLTKSPACWFAKPKITTFVENKTEAVNLLYMSQPYPNPAKDFIKTKIYWDNSKDINDAVFGVYNIFGSLVSKNEQFDIELFNEYSAYLTWNFKDMNSGVYFIKMSLDGDTKSIPIVVLR